MGVPSDQHNEWLDRQALEARMETDPELRDLLAAAWDEGKWAAYNAERDGFDGAETANPYRGEGVGE